MFFAFLSLTLFPEGVILLFFEKGHSRNICDRVTGNCRISFMGMNFYIPQEMVDRMNTIKNVFAEYVDFLDPESFMFEGWDELFRSCMDPIPYLSALHGYTSSHFYEFKKGLLKIRYTFESEVLYTHAYVRDPTTGTYTDEAATSCGDKLLDLVFKNDANFENATYQDIRLQGMIIIS